MRADAVFEGGGVKGIAFLGAVEQMEEAGYDWNSLAGTSAGSIIAAMLAAGFTGKEITRKFSQFPFHKLEAKKGLNRIPVLGPLSSVLLYDGVYTLSYLEEWMVEQLKEKGVYTFGDLPSNRIKVVIADVTQNRMSVLPDDLPLYGIDPARFSIARAVRLSCSIPFFFRPLRLQQHVIVDGGILSNYPIWLFDSKEIPRWPTFGFRLTGPNMVAQHPVKGPIDLLMALFRTMTEAHDKRYIDSHNAARTIFIEGIHISSTHFHLTRQDKEHLIYLGREAVRKFLRKWNFSSYIYQHRKIRQPETPIVRINM